MQSWWSFSRSHDKGWSLYSTSSRDSILLPLIMILIHIVYIICLLHHLQTSQDSHHDFIICSHGPTSSSSLVSPIPSVPSAETHNFDSVSSTAPYTPNSDSSIDSPLHTPTLPIRTSSRLVKPPSYLQLSFQLSLFFASIRSDFC